MSLVDAFAVVRGGQRHYLCRYTDPGGPKDTAFFGIWTDSEPCFRAMAERERAALGVPARLALKAVRLGELDANYALCFGVGSEARAVQAFMFMFSPSLDQVALPSGTSPDAEVTTMMLKPGVASVQIGLVPVSGGRFAVAIRQDGMASHWRVAFLAEDETAARVACDNLITDMTALGGWSHAR
jgi:hypothetical protein